MEKRRSAKNGTEKRTYDLSCYRRLGPWRRRSPPPPVSTPQSEADQARVPFIRMLPQPLVSSVPFSALARRLRLVASITQPLQILQGMVIARNNVIAIRSDSITILRMNPRFAASMRPSLDHGPAALPIVGQPESSVAAVPVHPVAHVAPPAPIPGIWGPCPAIAPARIGSALRRNVGAPMPGVEPGGTLA